MKFININTKNEVSFGFLIHNEKTKFSIQFPVEGATEDYYLSNGYYKLVEVTPPIDVLLQFYGDNVDTIDTETKVVTRTREVIDIDINIIRARKKSDFSIKSNLEISEGYVVNNGDRFKYQLIDLNLLMANIELARITPDALVKVILFDNTVKDVTIVEAGNIYRELAAQAKLKRDYLDERNHLIDTMIISEDINDLVY